MTKAENPPPLVGDFFNLGSEGDKPLSELAYAGGFAGDEARGPDCT